MDWEVRAELNQSRRFNQIAVHLIEMCCRLALLQILPICLCSL
jgi:hypothetical protein